MSIKDMKPSCANDLQEKLDATQTHLNKTTKVIDYLSERKEGEIWTYINQHYVPIPVDVLIPAMLVRHNELLAHHHKLAEAKRVLDATLKGLLSD
ncbi:hypothetical protein PP101_23 [Pectobacterium phage PP101]|uniref:Uncharacterized protein n=1 Tax=Pectobacterium phage PP101 TaxID=1916414 RepID=A0A1J0MEP0_9CAUD|nr:hypothetical protein HOR42_gp23 [Pectobacterium phage PP101]APD19685.1 hypothetical protein PP101_23 [Pectobacterium phage PP101]